MIARSSIDDRATMAGVLRLTYRELGNRLGLTPDGARFLARRRMWAIETRNDGRKVVTVSETDLAAEVERSPRSSADDLAIIGASNRPNGELIGELRGRIEQAEAGRDRLAAELAELRRERDDLAGTEAAARERAARAEGEVTALRDALRDLAGRLDRAEAVLSLPWWRRLIGMG